MLKEAIEFWSIIELQLDVYRDELRKTCSSSLLGSKMTYPLSARQQHMATAKSIKTPQDIFIKRRIEEQNIGLIYQQDVLEESQHQQGQHTLHLWHMEEAIHVVVKVLLLVSTRKRR